MIFKTFNSDIDKISAKWGMFGRSFNDIGTAIQNKIISFNEEFEQTGKILNSWKNSDSIWKRLYPSKESIKSQLIDVDALYPDISDTTASKLLTNLQNEQILVNANKKSWQDYFDGLGKGEKWQIEFVQNTDLQKASLDDVKKAYNSAREAAIAHNAALKQQTLGAKAAKKGMQALATVGNMIAMWAISEVISGLYELSQVSETLANNAKKLGESFKSTKSDIESYKSQIEESHKTINDCDSSIEEVTSARQNLMTVQDELIAKFGDEKETIDIITQAINGQSDALDELTQKQWQATKNEFNKSNWKNDFANWQKGYSDNIDRMVNEMENAWGNIKMSTSDYFGGKYDDIIKRLEEAGWKYSPSSETFIKGGSVEDLYEEIVEIQALVGDDMPNNFLKSLTNDANKLKDTLDDYEEMWDAYILNDRIFADKDLADSWKEVNDAYTKYQNAVSSGDKTAIEEATDGFATSINEVLNDENVDDSVKDYFRDMYPALYREVEKWEFKTYIVPEFDTSGLQGKTQADVLKMLQTEGTQDGEDVFNSILESADKYGLVIGEDSEKIQQLLDLLVQWGILQGTIADQDDSEPDTFSITQTISDLKDLNNELDNLGSAIANIDSEGKFDLGDLDSIADYFLGLKDITYNIDSVNNALQTLGDGNATLEEQTDAINTLATEYLNTSGVLNELTKENKDLMTLQLQRMGIVNAEEIINAKLNQTYGKLIEAEEIAEQQSINLTTVTYDEINSLLAEGQVSEQTSQLLAYYALQKQYCNDKVISTEGDCQNIINLAKAAGYSTEVLTKLETLKARMADPFATYEMKANVSNAIKDILNTANANMADYNIQIPQAIYNGGSNAAKALEDANKSAQSSAKETEDTYEKLFDFFERRINVLNDALELLNANLENVIGSNNKNLLIDAQIGINKESINNYTDALDIYQQKANEALSKIPAEFQDKIVNGAVAITDFIGSGNEDLVNAIEDYQNWADKVADCKQELAELKETLRQLELDKFNNIIEDFTNQFGISTNAQELINKQIDLFEEAGQLIGDGFYKGLIKESESQLNILEQEKQALINELNTGLQNGLIEKGSDEWLEMINSLNDVDGSILDCKKDIEEFNNSIQQLHWDIIGRIQNNFSDLSSEISNLVGLIDEVDVSNKEGLWSLEGLTQLGLYAQEYERAIYTSQMYEDEIEKLNQAYMEGKYSATEYADKLSELKDEQWNEINASEDAKDAIVELNKARIDIMVKGIEEEIEAMKELTDSKKEALDAEKDLNDYRNSLVEKNKSVTDLERQIAAMQNDSTASTVAKRKQLEEQLAEAKQDLADFEYEHSIEVQKEALDQQYETNY